MYVDWANRLSDSSMLWQNFFLALSTAQEQEPLMEVYDCYSSFQNDIVGFSVIW